MYKKDYLKKKLEDLIENKKDMDTSLSTKKQAELIGIPYPTFMKYVNGTALCNIENLALIADYYNVSTDWLLGRTNGKSIDDKERAAVDVTGLSENAISSLKALTTSEKGVSEVIEAILKNKYFEEAILDIIHLLTYPTDKPENYFEFEGHSIETKKFLRSSVNDELSSLGHNLLTDEKLKGVLNNG